MLSLPTIVPSYYKIVEGGLFVFFYLSDKGEKKNPARISGGVYYDFLKDVIWMIYPGRVFNDCMTYCFLSKSGWFT